jgi:hypothetical protein
MDYVWNCVCGAKTACRPEDHKIGAVFQCPGCQQVWGHVRSRFCGPAWVRISDADVRFRRLLEQPPAEDE